jgi:putative PIG3 family NAD(P)H quinone oxidoreductase
MIPGTMTAIELAGPGGPDALRLTKRPVPPVEAGEVLIRVEAAGVNRVDIIQRTGGYTPPYGVTDIPGVEIAGTVAAVGAGAKQTIGDKVCALVIGGGYAEYCAVPSPQVMPLPTGYDMVRAAAIPETLFTVWTNMFDHGRMAKGESVLIHGGASGIGTTAIKMAQEFGAKAVFVTAGSAEKCAACVDLGATQAINYRLEDFVGIVRRATEGRGVDLILDMVAGAYVPRNLACLAPDGRLVLIGLMSGTREIEINGSQIMMNRLTVTGSSLRGQSIAQKEKIAAALGREVWPRLAAGRMAPVVDSVYRFDQAAEAHRRLEGGGHVGKVVLTVG